MSKHFGYFMVLMSRKKVDPIIGRKNNKDLEDVSHQIYTRKKDC